MPHRDSSPDDAARASTPSHQPPRASGRMSEAVIGNGSGSDDGVPPSDWLAEREVAPKPDAAAGIELGDGKTHRLHPGTGLESKRGQV